MTFPKRWLEDDDAASAVRDVLRSGRAGMDPPDGARDAVWLALAAQIGTAGAAGVAASAKAAASASVKVAAGASATTTGAGAAGAASGGMLKAILIGAFSGLVVMSGYTALAPSPAPSPSPPSAPSALDLAPPASPQPAEVQRGPAAPAEQPPSAAPPSPAPRAGSTSLAASPSEAGEPPVIAQAPAPGSPEERASRLREENDLVGQARAALRSGDPGRAMMILEQARTKFPDGVLGQEREALAIEALARSGAREAASTRAAAFIRSHPTSPHAARLQAFVLP